MQYGVRTMYLVFGSLLILGQLIFAIGGSTSSIYTILIGRMIFGFGGESINIIKYALVFKWFPKSGIALPLALNISISRLGSVLNSILSPRLSNVK